jgi:hypothetical protein
MSESRDERRSSMAPPGSTPEYNGVIEDIVVHPLSPSMGLLDTRMMIFFQTLPVRNLLIGVKDRPVCCVLRQSPL